MQRNQVQVKVVILGNSGVGKSSIILRFVADNFKSDGEATIGASYMGKIMQFNDKSIKFNIWDTAGQERFHTLAKMYYRDADAAILVYDITNQESFDGLKRWHAELLQNGPKDIKKVLVGNKQDLISQEEISPDEVIEYANSIGATYVKTSAKTNYGVEQVFKDIAGKICPGIESASTQRRKQTITINNETKKKQKASSGCC